VDPISDGNLLPEIAQVVEELEFIDGHAITWGKKLKARVNRSKAAAFLLLALPGTGGVAQPPRPGLPPQ
jgi:hypothetical protein